MSVQKSISGEQTARRPSERAKYAVLPAKEELIQMRDQDMTHQDIADEAYRRTGERVTRNAVTMALRRAGITGTVRRYTDLIPWRVRTIHEHSYHLAMLRFEARRRRELGLTKEQERRLDGWLGRLASASAVAPEGWVVFYKPDSPDGFYLVPREDEDEDIIRQPDEEATAAER